MSQLRNSRATLIGGNIISLIQIFDSYKFDLILMDNNLPDMLGLEASKCMREYEDLFNIEKTDKTHIIAVTMDPLTGNFLSFTIY